MTKRAKVFSNQIKTIRENKIMDILPYKRNNLFHAINIKCKNRTKGNKTGNTY
jgi:hypothetical protein